MFSNMYFYCYIAIPTLFLRKLRYSKSFPTSVFTRYQIYTELQMFYRILYLDHWWLMLRISILSSASKLSVLLGLYNKNTGTWFNRCMCYWNLQFLNNESIIKTKVLLPQAYNSRFLRSYLGSLVYLLANFFKLFGFPTFRFWAYLMKVIPETRCVH